MSYQEKLEQFQQLRRSRAKTARERIEQLVDPESFVEFNAFHGVGASGSGVVTGYALIDGRSVFVYAHEPSQSAFREQQAQKICMLLERAVQTGTPAVGILSSNGAALQDGLAAAAGYGKILAAAAKASGRVPHLMIAEGPAVGAMALFARCADVLVAVDSALLGTATATGAQLSAEEAARAGMAEFFAKDASEANRIVRQVLAYLPDNHLTETEFLDTDDEINRLCPELNTMAEEGYDVKQVIASVSDGGKFAELYADYAPEMVTAFAAIGGQSIGFAANQHLINGGRITASGAKKAARFVNLCNSFSVPLILLCDSEGFADEKAEELSGLTSAGARLPFLLAQASVPVITLVLSQAIGSAYIAMGSKSLGADISYAWVGAKIGLLRPEQATALLKGEEVRSSEDPVQARAEIAQEYAEKSMSAMEAAEAGYLDEPIEPAQTRQYLAAALEALYNKREPYTAGKNAVFPL